ncbi:methyltransferase [Microvirga ossetica]|jgi:methyltransferase family protein|uniref:Methyltransferase n=1 Tax=Microvirga ossetica TaxID=1882682 RepID=A0A1B2EKK8_9HYPH|nr:class I SAM-dependent methyltransferase [Microvirga ossetica]ANY80518.1 methyltransferase [Microvirga ossetica]
MTGTRDTLLKRIWRGQDPFLNYPALLYRQDRQGWGSSHPYLTEAIEALRPSVVVEVGVWKGGSTISLASTMKAMNLDAVVIAVDTWLGAWDHWNNDEWFAHLNFIHGYPALYHTFASNIVGEGLQGHVLPLPLDSVNAAYVLRNYDVQADVIHIDGGHDYGAVMSDLREWWPMLKPGGVLIGDDYPHWPGVKKAFDDFFTEQGRFPFEFEEPKCRIFK